MDLNLVRVFVAIYETGSMTAAGERLFVTQSAVSQALGRLREQLDDPLFERTGRGMRPTPLATSIFPGFFDAIVSIDRTVESVHAFVPRSSERTFHIALSELGEIGWLAAVFDAVHREAPRARIEVVHLESAELESWLRRGTVDLAISPLELSSDFARALVKRERYGVAMSSSNVLADGDMTVDAYAACARASVESDSGAHLLEAAHRRIGGTRPALVSVQHFATLPPLLSRSDELIATIPETIAAGWAESWPIVMRELPFEMDAIELNLYRRATSQHAGALDWFFSVVAKTIAGSGGEFTVIQGDASVP